MEKKKEKISKKLKFNTSTIIYIGVTILLFVVIGYFLFDLYVF